MKPKKAKEMELQIAAWIDNNTFWGCEPNFIKELRERFELEDIVEFLGLMDRYCHSCWDGDRMCCCQRDD